MGRQYRTGIYSNDEEDLTKVKAFLDKKQVVAEKQIQVEVGKLNNFIIAEDYHQDYLEKIQQAIVIST